jgi:hypothetical protein
MAAMAPRVFRSCAPGVRVLRPFLHGGMTAIPRRTAPWIAPRDRGVVCRTPAGDRSGPAPDLAALPADGWTQHSAGVGATGHSTQGGGPGRRQPLDH